MEPFFTTEHAGYSCELHYDEDPPNPADWDNLGTLVLSRSLARDWQPHGTETMGGAEEDAIERGGFALLYRYLRLTSAVVAAVPFRFADYGWMYATDADDDRMVGYIYTTAEQVRKLCGEEEPYSSRSWQEEALRGELDVWRSYVEGEVAGYVVRDPSGAVVESLWGIYPDDADREPTDKATANYRAAWDALPQYLRGYADALAEAFEAAEYEADEREHAANQDVATA